ncbi:hypothetical protein [Aneurinibacillus terranovensis]|uniref:hypothetical protein n=1 Tax=Aneurinibacillus terranovensis TaxID=278991 RepID=UPI00041C15BB|nr:hypothetical protein [Aneurinibacillus terranovensis]
MITLEFKKRINQSFDIDNMKEESKIIADILSKLEPCDIEQGIDLAERLLYIYKRILSITNTDKH